MLASSHLLPSQFRFGRCEIDSAKRTLLRRGRGVEVEPRVFDLLLHLIEHHHRVVSAEELLDTVWGGVEVTASSVSQAVHKARVAIGDARKTPRALVTVRGKGFRFVAPLRADGDAPTPEPDDFVGREFELARLERALECARAGRGGLVALSGAPGIGKSRTAHELVTRALGRRAEALVVRCPSGGALPGFWPWRQLARKLASRRTRAELEALGERRMTALIAAERALAAGGERGGPTPGADLHAQLFSTAVAGLAMLAREQLLLFVLDDLHRADVASLHFLRFLADSLPEMRLLVVATFRDAELEAQEEKASLFADAERAADGETLTLAALSAEETLALAQKHLGRPVADPLLDALGTLSGGNPFVLGELARLCQRPGAGVPSSALPLPPAVQAAVTAHVHRLGPQVQQLLTMAAVIGLRFELATLAAACDVAPDEGFRSLVAASAAHVVTPLVGKPHAFRFVHALVRETLYESLDARDRAQHHLRAARALDASSRANPALLSYHYFEAAAVGGAERGVEAACRAARLAASRLDFEAATLEFERALTCLDFVPGAPPRRRCEILIDAARAASRRDPRRGGLLLIESARLARRLGETAQSLRVAIEAAGAEVDLEALGLCAAMAEAIGPASAENRAAHVNAARD